MAIKNVYVHPGDVLKIHVVNDTEAKPTKESWQSELRPRYMLLTIRDAETVGFSDYSYQFRVESANGSLIRWKQ